MKKLMVAALLCLLLAGCGWMDGHYVSVRPHTNQPSQELRGTISVSSVSEMEQALDTLVSQGAESAVISASKMSRQFLEMGIGRAVSHCMNQTALGAYAVSDITWEAGTTGGENSLALRITYRHGLGEIRRIRRVKTVAEAKTLVERALQQCSAGIAIFIEGEEDADFAQMVEDYADAHPEIVMELPQVGVSRYPEEGTPWIVELQFTYQTSREALREMQVYVQPVFSAARYYVMGETDQRVKFTQLASFLMERNQFTVETSITPGYSLLRHGVGDSKAFACMYGAMCRQAGLECLMVSGTRAGEPHFWNILSIDGRYYHADLLHPGPEGELLLLLDEQMQGYVWDYSAYPACTEETPPST